MFIEAEVIVEADPGISAILIRFNIHLLIFHCPPQPLYEEIIVVLPFPIHANPDPVLLKGPGEGLTGELVSLVRVEYLGLAFPERFLQSLGTEAGIQCVTGLIYPLATSSYTA